MRRLLLLLPLLATPARAEGDPKLALMAPEPGCEAPALVTAALARQVQAAEAPPPFRMALFACARAGEGAPKAPLRRT
jgi:hypothetical protein